MDMAVANLLKHKIWFSLMDQTSNPIGSFPHYKGYHYRSNVIEHGKNIGLNHTNELYDKTKPIIYYILSTMQRYTEELRVLYHINQWEAIIMIGLIREEDRADYITHSIKYEDGEGGFNQSEGEITWHGDHPRNLIDDKFSIDVEAFVYYRIFIRIEEGYDSSDSSDEEEYAPPTKSYREDCCVICLESKPNILYLYCMHIAVCDSCDRLKETGRYKCDVCRSGVFERVKI